MSAITPSFAIFPLLILVSLLVRPGSVYSADPAVDIDRTPVTVTADIVKAKLKEVEASTELDEASKATLTELYRKTLSNLEKARSNSETSAAFGRARETAPAETKTIREKLETAKEKSPEVILEVSEKTPLAEVEQVLLNEKANLAAVEAKLSELEKQLAGEAERPNAIRQRITEGRQTVTQVETDLKKPAVAGELPVLTEARRWSLETQQQALSTELKMLDQELLSQPMRIELMKAQRNTTERSLARQKQRVTLLEELIAQLRRAQAEKARQEAEIVEAELAGKHPLIQQLAEENTELTDRLSEMSITLEQVASGDELADRQAKRIQEEFNATQQKLEIAGLSQALGRILLEQRRLLPDVRDIQKQAGKREGLIADTAFQQIQDNGELKRLRNLGNYLDELTVALPAHEVEPMRADLEELANKRLELIGKAISLGEAYLRSLGELDFAQNQLINVVETYDAFLAERLLWIRSSAPPNLAMIGAVPRQVYELLSPVRWFDVTRILLLRFTQSPVPWLAVIAFTLLVLKQGRMRDALVESGRKIIKPRSDRFSFTLQALALTLLLAAPWPLLLAAIGWQLSASLEATQFSGALAHALMVLAPAYFYLEAFRVLCLPGGLGEAHFRWSAASLKGLRRQLGILMLSFLPAGLVAILTIRGGATGFEGGLERLAFVVLVLSLSYFFYQLFGPRRAVLAESFKRHPTSPLARFRYLWLAMALGLPLFLVVLAILGYLYTAGTLFGRLVDTLWLVLGFIVIQQLAVRWLLMTRRKLAFEAAMERRRAALATREEEKKEGEEEGEESQYQVEEPEIDLFALNQESRKLVNTAVVFSAIIGLWFIWSDVLPAFGFLDKVSLWHQTSVIEGVETVLPVTLADLVLALLIGIVTIVAARNFPSLLEIIMLKRPSITSGGRYAATSLSKYSIAAIGILLALSTIGASWSQVQWLAAALSVGIGFGLQEIVANFISGIIILFERPIRVGDVVSIGETDGVVTRIQIRATTIRNWERQELLVPNKEFITGRLLNWSLSDQTTRVKVPVGIAYGSDVNKAMELMHKAAKENEKVLEEPSPSIVFDAFGDNALNLVLRCFVGEQDDRMPTITALHQAINDKFNAAGIVIAFPQRDVHLDTSQPLDVRIRHDNPS